MVFKNRIPVTDFNTVHGSCYTFIHIIWYSMKGASLLGYSIKGTSFLKTCFVHEGWPCWNRQAKLKLKLENGDFYFVSTFESYMRQWRLAGLDVKKKTNKKLQVSHLASQLHVGSLILSSGDVSTQLLCPISKRWCVQHGRDWTLVVVYNQPRYSLPAKLRLDTESKSKGAFKTKFLVLTFNSISFTCWTKRVLRKRTPWMSPLWEVWVAVPRLRRQKATRAVPLSPISVVCYFCWWPCRPLSHKETL